MQPLANRESMTRQQQPSPAELEHVDCPLCGRTNAEPLLKSTDYLSGERFTVVQCDTCTLAFVNPRPTAAAIGRYYPPAYYGNRHPLFKVRLMDLRRRKLGDVPAQQRVLDIGCGQGEFMEAMQRAGHTATGLSSAPIRRSRDPPVSTFATPASCQHSPMLLSTSSRCGTFSSICTRRAKC